MVEWWEVLRCIFRMRWKVYYYIYITYNVSCTSKYKNIFSLSNLSKFYFTKLLENKMIVYKKIFYNTHVDFIQRVIAKLKVKV